MANEQTKYEETFIVPGGNIYSNTVELDGVKPMTQAINELYFGAYSNLINQIGLHNNLELALYIKINKTDRMPVYATPELRCRMETIPIIQHDVSYYKPTYNELTPCTPHNRKCTLKERLKILFRGEL